MRQARRGYYQTLRCAAPPDAVWRALVEPAALAVWCGDHAQVDGRVGGHYAIRARRLGPREAHIDAYEPNRRLRLILHPSPDWPATDDEAVVEDFLIDAGAAETVLRLIGSGVPDGDEWDATLLHLRSAWAVTFADLRKFLLTPPARRSP